jgi:hypothetical protein
MNLSKYNDLHKSTSVNSMPINFEIKYINSKITIFDEIQVSPNSTKEKMVHFDGLLL